MTMPSFEIVRESKVVGRLEFTPHEVRVVPPRGSAATFKFEQVKTIQLLVRQEVNGTAAITLGALGAVLAGPLGAASGAYAGRLMRQCSFRVHFMDGLSVSCVGATVLFDALCGHARSAGASVDKG